MTTTRRIASSLLPLIGALLPLAACSGPEAIEEGGLPVLDADGIDRELAALKGKPLLVNLWATWCPPCIEEMPHLVEVHESALAAGGEVVGISLDMLEERFDLADQTKKVERFVERRKLPFPCWVWNGADKAAVFAALGIDDPEGIPVTIAINAQGAVVETHVGGTDLERFEELFALANGDG